ncbi:MAG: rod-binding protein [Rhodospirillales bacterium]|nr:rod-binding protein [Rhodospirillales bacterium]MDE2577048.1 rod-binding protein [Rhodospirillales bacterium]
MAGAVLAADQSAPSAAQLARPAVARAWKAAHAFEAMALDQFLAPMFKTVDLAHGPFGGGDGEAAWQPMMVEQLAGSLAAQGGLGIAVPVFHQILRLQEAHSRRQA